MRNFKGILAGALLLANPLTAQPINLAFPLDCTLGDTCFIQQFMDHDPSSGDTDYTCGPLTYDAHTGTDIRLKNRLAMTGGVDVLAAAGGVVLGTRDGELDIAQDDTSAPDISDKECGNGVLLGHENGWRTQYCHMKKGSISVRKGQRLNAGETLGQIGLSGLTQFPHLHITVRKDRDLVDPFAPKATTCGTASSQLWTTPIPYVAGGILNAGIANSLPSYTDIRAGSDPVLTLSSDAPAIVAWGLAYGLQKGDIISLKLFGPTGKLVVQDQIPMTKNRAQDYRAVGKRRPKSGWQTGAYRALIEILRDEKTYDQSEIRVIIEP